MGLGADVACILELYTSEARTWRGCEGSAQRHRFGGGGGEETHPSQERDLNSTSLRLGDAIVLCLEDASSRFLQLSGLSLQVRAVEVALWPQYARYSKVHGVVPGSDPPAECPNFNDNTAGLVRLAH
jgi:hypothetical protein